LSFFAEVLSQNWPQSKLVEVRKQLVISMQHQVQLWRWKMSEVLLDVRAVLLKLFDSFLEIALKFKRRRNKVTIKSRICLKRFHHGFHVPVIAACQALACESERCCDFLLAFGSRKILVNVDAVEN
jgi:hypothetical protein